MRGESGKPLHERGVVVLATQSRPDRHEDFAREHGFDGAADFGRADGFVQIAGGAQLEGAADDLMILDRRDDHHRDVRVLRTQQQQAGKAAHTRHVEIKQHQVAFAVGVERGTQFIEVARLVDGNGGVASGQRLVQRRAEQGMVVDDDYAAARHAAVP